MPSKGSLCKYRRISSTKNSEEHLHVPQVTPGELPSSIGSIGQDPDRLWGGNGEPQLPPPEILNSKGVRAAVIQQLPVSSQVASVGSSKCRQE